MRRLSMVLVATAALAIACARPSAAQYAAQLYPYCSLSASNGATNCYIASRKQCGRNTCISKPWYIGGERARPFLEGRKGLVPRTRSSHTLRGESGVRTSGSKAALES